MELLGSIGSALLTGVLSAAVTIVIAIRTWRREDLTAQSELKDRLMALAAGEERFRRESEQRDAELMQSADALRQEMQARAADRAVWENQFLREAYVEVLQAQRRCREACVALALHGGAEGNPELAARAKDAHAAFIETYHLANLDLPREVWKDLRRLRGVLDVMLEDSVEARSVGDLATYARDARQNLVGSFRATLGHERLQRRKPIPKKDELRSRSRILRPSVR